MSRAPLVRAVAFFALGIFLGLARPASGQLLSFLVPAGLFCFALCALVAAGRARLSARALFLLIAAAGVDAGVATRASTDRSCANRLPAGVRMAVHGTVLQGGESPRVRVSKIELNAGPWPCVVELGARWGGRAGADGEGAPVPRAGAGFGAVARLWRPPGAGSASAGGLLLVDSAWAEVDGHMRVGGWRRALAAARAGARARVDALYPRRAGLVASLLLAQRDALDADVRERYARAGLSHLLAISGLHVGLVAGVLLLLVGALRLRRRAASMAAALGTVSYVAFLGAPHAATRAAVQIVLLLAGRALQRPAQAASLVATAALLILAADPAALRSPGFQLSFAGVTGILLLRRPLLNQLRAGAARAGWGGAAGNGRSAVTLRWLSDGLATSLAATLATSPIAAWHFGRLAPIGVVANLAAIPLLGLIIPTLALSLLAHLAAPPLGTFLAGAGNSLLAALDRIASVAAAVPGGAVAVSGPDVVVLAAALAAGYLLSRRLGRVRSTLRFAAWGAVTAAVVALAPVRPTSGHIELHMIDVGQGDAFALRTPAGRWVLVDAGPASGDYDAGARKVVPYLRRHGARRLEMLLLSHPDADHTGGAAAVVRALHPRWVGDPGVPAGKQLYVDLLRASAAEHVPWAGLSRGVRFDLDGVGIDILHPATVGPPVDDANDASLVLRISYGDFAALLTGDAPLAVERQLADRYGRDLAVAVLKIGHHGSASATSDALLDATGARLALISVGDGNRYGHPDPSVVHRLQQHGIRMVRSDRSGSVVIVADRSGRFEVEREREGER